MVELTSQLAGNTLVFTVGYAIFGVLITLYSLYLNWKQAKVNTQMQEVINVLKEIRDMRWEK